MAQHDYDIANQDGAAFRADINAALAAIVSQNSAATEPATTFAYQFWADTTAGKLKQRNAANSAWITLLDLATGLNLDIISQAEAEAGSATTARSWTAQRVAQAIAVLGGGGSGAFALSSDISPAQITTNQNDYSPSGLSTASTLRLYSDAARDITGIQGGADGRVLILHNVGTFSMTLRKESGSSSAANRFGFDTDVVLSVGRSIMLQYDTTVARWRRISADGFGGVAVLTASNATYTPPASRMLVICVGGGASGRRITGAGAAPGGGAGGVAIKFLTGINPATSINVTIGAGGDGSVSNGSNGGTTSFGAHCSATGGSFPAAVAGVGGGPGSGSGGDINLSVGRGGYTIASVALSGAGADGLFGTGGAPVEGFTNGNAGTGYGAGGGGGHVATSGTANAGNGAGGAVFIFY